MLTIQLEGHMKKMMINSWQLMREHLMLREN